MPNIRTAFSLLRVIRSKIRNRSRLLVALRVSKPKAAAAQGAIRPLRTRTGEECYPPKFVRRIARAAPCALLDRNACSVVGACRLHRPPRLRRAQCCRFEPLQGTLCTLARPHFSWQECSVPAECGLGSLSRSWSMRRERSSPRRHTASRSGFKDHITAGRVECRLMASMTQHYPGIWSEHRGPPCELIRNPPQPLPATLLASSRGQAGSGAEEDALMPSTMRRSRRLIPLRLTHER